jgi:hypothetical protein
MAFESESYVEAYASAVDLFRAARTIRNNLTRFDYKVNDVREFHSPTIGIGMSIPDNVDVVKCVYTDFADKYDMLLMQAADLNRTLTGTVGVNIFNDQYGVTVEEPSDQKAIERALKKWGRQTPLDSISNAVFGQDDLETDDVWRDTHKGFILIAAARLILQSYCVACDVLFIGINFKSLAEVTAIAYASQINTTNSSLIWYDNAWGNQFLMSGNNAPVQMLSIKCNGLQRTLAYAPLIINTSWKDLVSGIVSAYYHYPLPFIVKLKKALARYSAICCLVRTMNLHGIVSSYELQYALSWL